MERVSKIWEIELQAVLEINKLGHRKRILYSVAERNKLLPPNLEEINGVDSVRETDLYQILFITGFLVICLINLLFTCF